MSVHNVARVGQTLPPSPARLRVMSTPGNALPSHLASDYVSAEMEDEGEELEPASPVAHVVNEGPKSRKKKTADVRWTQHMRDKLVQQVFYLKAYKRTKNETKQQKFQRIKEILEGDRDFSILGTEKCWESFKSQWDGVYNTFLAKYGISKEGANLSALDPEVAERYTETEKVLRDIAEELFMEDEEKKEKDAKEKKRRQACLTHERAILARQSGPSSAPDSGGRDSVASGLTDDQTSAQVGTVRSLLDSFLPTGGLSSSPSKEEIELKKIEAKNEQLKLRMGIKGLELAMMMQMKKRKRSKRSRSPSPSSSSSSSSDYDNDFGIPGDSGRSAPSHPTQG